MIDSGSRVDNLGKFTPEQIIQHGAVTVGNRPALHFAEFSADRLDEILFTA
jgi:hypothetical protein